MAVLQTGSTKCAALEGVLLLRVALQLDGAMSERVDLHRASATGILTNKDEAGAARNPADVVASKSEALVDMLNNLGAGSGIHRYKDLTR
jgi:hypothetical protein